MLCDSLRCVYQLLEDSVLLKCFLKFHRNLVLRQEACLAKLTAHKRPLPGFFWLLEHHVLERLGLELSEVKVLAKRTHLTVLVVVSTFLSMVAV
jgi:hypothetical protein